MSTRKRRIDEKTYRSTWEDVENWVQALWEDFGAQVRTTVFIPHPAATVNAAVTCEVYVAGVNGLAVELWRSWKVLDLRQPHCAEHWALQMLSQAWLELDRDRRSAERQATLL